MQFPSEDAFMEYARSTGRSYVVFSLIQGSSDAEKHLGTLTLELYNDIAPRTCENFIKFCAESGPFRYKGSPIHRIVKKGYIQGGDVVDGTGKGTPQHSLPDETFAVKHDDVGILAMASIGEPHSAYSQFYITLAPLPWLDGKRVAFGRVLTADGIALLHNLEGLVLNNERPVPEVIVTDVKVLHLPEQ